jgi:arylsulfatase A-like enzyme
MRGGKAALWNDETMADTLTGRAVSFIDRNARRPFFLYFATHDIHVPRSPNHRFSQATPMGPRGNVIAELDWCAGRLVRALDERGLLANTLLVFTSDNGGVVDDGYQDEAVEKLGSHRPNGPLRGGKYSNFEGGTRIPFIVHWPARVKAGVAGSLVSHVDLLRSLAQLTGAHLAPGAAPDSENVLGALVGESPKGRQLLVEQAGDLALRDGNWKYISPGKGPKIQKDTNTEMGTDPGPQLYDLAADIGETTNLAARHPARVKDMAEKLRKIQAAPAGA